MLGYMREHARALVQKSVRGAREIGSTQGADNVSVGVYARVRARSVSLGRAHAVCVCLCVCLLVRLSIIPLSRGEWVCIFTMGTRVMQPQLRRGTAWHFTCVYNCTRLVAYNLANEYVVGV